MTEPAGPLASPGYHLVIAAQRWRRELGIRLRPLGLTPAQFDLLAGLSWVSRIDPDPTQQAVADFAGMDRMMASRLAAALEGRGLLERIGDPADARVKRLRLTASGRQLVGPATAQARAVDAELFTRVPDAARLREELRVIASEARG